MQNFIKNIPLRSRDRASFTFSEFRPRHSLDRYQMVFGKLFGLHLVNINVNAKNLSNYSHRLRVMATLILRWGLWNYLTNHKDEVYTCRAHFNFSHFKPRQSLVQRQIIFGLDRVNINVYAKIHQNIPWELGPVSLFQNWDLGKASTDDKWHLTISWARSCQYLCVC